MGALESEVRDAFAHDGVLSRAAEQFRERDGQTQMALAVARTIEHGGVLVVEAGTGVGKTFSYLVPALLSGERVLLSTATKTLQDQLFLRDIPAVRDALKLSLTVAMLKGRANYVCRYHLANAQIDARLYHKEDVLHLQNIARFAATTSSGDSRSGSRSEMRSLP